jgi:outer membrane lipoprotein-sorting protein
MRALAAACLLAAVVVPACSRAPADPVEALLAELEAAAEARDAERFAERVAPAFHGSYGLGRPEALAQLKRYFAAYESVAIDVYGVETERDGASARVRCVVDFSGKGRQVFGLEGLVPPSAVYRFDLDVADEGGVWLVRAATWEPAEPAEE